MAVKIELVPDGTMDAFVREVVEEETKADAFLIGVHDGPGG